MVSKGVATARTAGLVVAWLVVAVVDAVVSAVGDVCVVAGVEAAVLEKLRMVRGWRAVVLLECDVGSLDGSCFMMDRVFLLFRFSRTGSGETDRIGVRVKE